MLLIAVIDERVEAVGGHHRDVAAAPAVPAVGPAELDELLAPEGDAAVPAVPAAQVDIRLVEKLHGKIAAPAARGGANENGGWRAIPQTEVAPRKGGGAEPGGFTLT